MPINELLATIPYLPSHQIEVTAEGEGTVSARMPFRREVTNLVGTVHAGALYTLAETVAGVAANNLVTGAHVAPLLREGHARYTRRAESDLVAEAKISTEVATRARGAFERERRADVAVDVTITDAEGEAVYVGNFDYALREMKR
jgi:uncharacterized protein (TIGR00369 family)